MRNIYDPSFYTLCPNALNMSHQAPKGFGKAIHFAVYRIRASHTDDITVHELALPLGEYPKGTTDVPVSVSEIKNIIVQPISSGTHLVIYPPGGKPQWHNLKDHGIPVYKIQPKATDQMPVANFITEFKVQSAPTI